MKKNKLPFLLVSLFFLMPSIVFAAKIKKDENLGIEYKPASKYKLESGNVRVCLYKNTGSFGVYGLTGSIFKVPLLSALNDFESSHFFVKIDGKEYDLSSSSFIREVRILDDRAQIHYLMAKKVAVAVEFELASSVPGNPSDVVCVNIYVSNLGRNKTEVALKGVFDTVLGENRFVHFRTSSGEKITSEKHFYGDDLRREKSIISSDGNSSIQFVFTGKGMTVPRLVTLSSEYGLEHSNWEPNLKDGRSFNNIHAYMNSALAVNWKPLLVGPSKTERISFCIAVAVNGTSPKGLRFVGLDASDVVDEPSDSENEELASSTSEESDSSNAEAGLATTPAVITENNVVEQKEADKSTKNDDEQNLGSNAEKRTEVDFVVAPIEDYQLDPVYIQNLIARINSLQSSSEVDHEEIRRLNAELDAILAKIRQK